MLLVDDREEQGEMLIVVTGRDADASEAERGRNGSSVIRKS